ncbi:MAG: hypothetical protein GQ574_26475 [Crocinitomix sp.]|nr:hypothetical protein [Crocinitomix sp.]
MKRLILLIGCTLTATCFGQAQLENPGFEGPWEDVIGTEDEPEDWSSLKTADALGVLAPIVIFQSEDAHTGDYCVRLLNVNSFDVIANGIMTNGQVHADFDPDLGNVYTNEGDADFNTVFNDRPDSLVAWVIYSPLEGDRGKIEVLLHDDSAPGILPETGSNAHWVGKARIDIDESYSEWTRVAAPFVYYNETNPDYVLTVVTSGDSTIAAEGSEMWVDDLELIYGDDASIETENVLEHQVFATSTGFTVNVADYSNAKIELYGLDGKVVYEAVLNSANSQHNIPAIGTFVYRIIKAEQIATGKVVLD